MKMIKNFITTLYILYNEIIEVMLILDEWVFLTTNTRLFSNNKRRADLKRKRNLVRKCKKNKIIENCLPICRDFNVNKFSGLIDGEIDAFEEFIQNYKIF